MRFVITTIVIFLVAFAIKVDLTEGTVPLANFENEQEKCEETYGVQYVTVLTVAGDTVQGLLSTYSADGITQAEKLAHFYQLNPHLKKQKLIAGEYVKVPVYKKKAKQC